MITSARNAAEYVHHSTVHHRPSHMLRECFLVLVICAVVEQVIEDHQ